ncbi:MAG: ABC transporter permease [Clostridiales bacterium]|jgi:spermidine/putrescine transport system permease protein|nr:ABC transporter permease [Clostridiales bacterium]
MLLFMYAPIAILIVYSFNASKSRANWTGFTFDWYIALFNDPEISKALYNTLTIAVLSSAISAVIGTAAAVGIDAMRGFKKTLVMAVTNIPVVNPDIVTGVSLMILYIAVFRFFPSLKLGYGTLLLSHVAFNTSYIILSVLPKLRQMDDNLYEAALDLGASPMAGFFKVILPEILPGIVTGALLAFTMSLDDFVVSFFTTGSGVSNLSILIYSMARRGVNPKINALSTIMFMAVLLLLYVINRTDTTKSKSKKLISEGDK